MLETPWQNVSDAIFHHAREHPRAPAVVDSRAALDYAEFADLVGRVSLYLHGLGIAPGERVALSLGNSVEHMVLAFATIRMGAILVDIPWLSGQAERDRVLAINRVDTIFIEPDAQPAPVARSIWVDAGWRSLAAAKPGDYRHEGSIDDDCNIGLSTGTTGAFKGIVKTHRHLLLRCHVLADLYAGTEILSVERPANFLLVGTTAGGVYFQRAVAQLCVGGSIVLVPGYLRTPDLMRTIAAWGDAVCFLVPAFCKNLLEAARQSGPMFPRIRALFAGGQPLPFADKVAMLERLTPNFYEHYGNGGCGPTTLLRPSEMLRKRESVGRASKLLEVEVVDAEGRPLPPGTVGRLRCKGPAVSTRFFDPSDGAGGGEAFADGGYYPGDIAMMDAEGYIYFKGREATAIRQAGGTVPAGDIEAVLAAHSLVREAVVVGRPAANGGEEAVAFVVLRGKLEHDELARHCSERLPPQKLPRQVYYLTEMPHTEGGKVDLVRLKAIAAGGAGRG
ncbi:MAG TPA: class I adenylate-forming enzyme family protein [Stellaceae bacterium]|nr:class I adenylate-forming enzyme family protein [Stellaceae bacterium]